MRNKLVALMPCGIAHHAVLSLLNEHLPDEQIVCAVLPEDNSVNGGGKHLYLPLAKEKVIKIKQATGDLLRLSARRIEQALQHQINDLEKRGAQTFLLLWEHTFSNLSATHAVLLDPQRVLPTLVGGITQGYQPGVLVADAMSLAFQVQKWRSLSPKPHFAIADPESNNALIDAALSLQEQGADVLILDCLEYHQRHRDFLQRLSGIPVLLSNLLIVKLAAELMG